jgi:flagellar hook-length control protein FliK
VPSTNVPIAPLPTNPASHESFANALASLESPATAQAQNPVQPNGDANPAATTAGAMPNELALAKLERLPERIGAPPLPARANPAAEAATPRASDPSSAAQLPALATLATPADADTAPNSGDAREGAQQRLHAPQLADSLAESALAQAFDRANSGATALGDASASIDSVPTAGADTGVDASSDIGSAASQAAHSLTHNPLAPRHLDPMRSAEQAAETSGPPLPPEAVPLHVEWLAERGGGTAVVDLHPPNLGRVEIAVRVVGDEVEVSIASQSDQVQAVIDSQRGQLEQSLGERSLRMTQFDLGLAGQNQSQRGNASSSRDPNGSARERREGADGRSRSSSLVPVVGAPIGSGPRSRAASGIDLHA